MDRELDNANPTILSLAQLPSRTQASGKGYLSEKDDDSLVFPYKDEPWASMLDLSSWIVPDEPTFKPEPIDEQEIYDHISTISDPEHPYTLGQLSVINLQDIHISPRLPATGIRLPQDITTVVVEITPTITHCSLATVIGLAVRVRLERMLPANFRVDVRVKAGTHQQDDQVNKQLADKERVAAALENDNLRGVLDKMMETCAVPSYSLPI